MLVPLDSPYMAAAARAMKHAFGRPPVYTREGGSIPIVATFHEALQADTLLLGWGQDDDNTHSPNEKFSLADFHRGIEPARLWEELSERSSREGWARVIVEKTRQSNRITAQTVPRRGACNHDTSAQSVRD